MTVDEVVETIAHFSTAKTRYEQRVIDAPTPELLEFWQTSIRVVESRIAFWQAMRPRVEQGLKIAECVQQYRQHGLIPQE